MLTLLIMNEYAKRHPPRIFYVRHTGSFNACTLPPYGIFINECHRGNQALLEHELVHWQQYQRQGLIRFSAGYVAGHLKHGYDRNPYEIEARANETPYARCNYTAAVRTGKSRTVHNPKFRR